MSQVDPDVVFSKRTATVVVVLGVASFIAMLILMARGEPNRKILTADPSVFSESSLGHRAAFEFLRESGLAVKTRRNRRSLAADSRTAVVAAEPQRSPEKKSLFEEEDEGAFDPETELHQLADQAFGLGAPFVLVLPKWKGDRVRTAGRLWIKNASLEPASQVIKPVDLLAEAAFNSRNVVRLGGQTARTLDVGDGKSVELVAPQLLRHDLSGLQPIVASSEGILIARIADHRGVWYVVSDPDLFNNHGLARGDNAAVLLNFLRGTLAVSSVLFDEVTHGFAAETPFMAELLNFPLVVVVLHAAALFGLLVWRGFARFGKPTPLPPRLQPGKAGLIENTAHLLASRGRLATSARRYYLDVLAEVAQRHHRDPHENPLTLHKALKEATAARKIEADLLGIAKTLVTDRRRSAGTVLNAATELHDWREKMLDER
jgi:hypothetical protein